MTAPIWIAVLLCSDRTAAKIGSKHGLDLQAEAEPREAEDLEGASRD